MSRSQPLGAFPYPAGMMLLPADELAGPLGAGLLEGRLPEQWPPALRAHALAHAGELDAALAELDGQDALTRCNRYLLSGEDADPAALAAALPAELAPLVEVLRYMLGGREAPPAVAEGADPVVVALSLAAQASAVLDAGRPQDAVALLHAASARAGEAAPALAAVLLGNAGSTAFEHGLDRDGARADLTAAAAALTATDLAVGKAELHYQLGTLEHEVAAAGGAALAPAMHHYYTALQLITVDDAPHLWASAQLNLATAYLATPMVEASDTLRMGIAIQAMRAALEVFTREEHPAQWSTATLNLANALVYTPSVKQGDNLVESVELYEQVLEHRDRTSDPLGRARVLANQGNVLAHLGIFDQAKAKLFEARFLFEEHLDSESALMVRGLLDEIVKQTTPQDGRGAGGRLALGGIGDLARHAAEARGE